MLSLFVSLLACTGSVQAQNVVQNATFDAALSPWSPSGSLAPDPVASGTASWTLLHNLDNLPGSGSVDTALAASPFQPANASFGLRQCVALPGAPVTVTQANYEASFLAVTSNPADGLANATVEVRFFSDASCTAFIPGAGGSQGVDLSPSLPLSDTAWYTIGDPSFLPPGGSIVASSAEVRAYVRTTGNTSNGYQVFYDLIVLSLNGTTPVALQHFGIE